MAKKKLEGDFKIIEPKKKDRYELEFRPLELTKDAMREKRKEMIESTRDTSELFKSYDGKCMLCGLDCDKKDCTVCEVPKFAPEITAKVIKKMFESKKNNKE